nr:MAG TPA: hypothetical protein [Caudoviricetes sp.]
MAALSRDELFVCLKPRKLLASLVVYSVFFIQFVQ